jgi:ribosomal protein S18 acetylase RimI-like enzyme
VNGNVAASASVKKDDKDTLGPIFVVPSFQGKGYGRVITQFAINEALRRGINNIYLEVVEWNTRAINLYTSLGFEIIQTAHNYRRSNALNN